MLLLMGLPSKTSQPEAFNYSTSQYHAYIINFMHNTHLCLSTGAVVLKPNNPFDEGTLPTAINYLECTGDEAQLSDCRINTELVSSCGRFADAGLACQGIGIVIYLYKMSAYNVCMQCQHTMCACNVSIQCLCTMIELYINNYICWVQSMDLHNPWIAQRKPWIHTLRD